MDSFILNFREILHDALSTSAIFMLVFIATTFFFTRKEKYDEKRHRAELDNMREYLETKIYHLTDRLLATNEKWQNVNHLIVSGSSRNTNNFDQTNNSNFLKSFGADSQIEKDLIFVLTPFHKDYEETYRSIKNICGMLNLNCLRGDEHYVQGELMPHIISLIAKARLIVANIDGRNPNVFYELGICHALGKQTILVAKATQEIPFDLRTNKIIFYHSERDLQDSLRTELARAFINDKVL